MDINAAITTNAQNLARLESAKLGFARLGLVGSELSVNASDSLNPLLGLGHCVANGLAIRPSALNGLGMFKRIQRIAGAHFSSISSGYYGMRAIAGILIADRSYSQLVEGPTLGRTENPVKGNDCPSNLEDKTFNIFLRSGECLKARPI